jgi:NADH-quinone oxidoreductase subunit G
MAIADAVRSGEIKALVILKENAMHLALSVEELARLPALIVMNNLHNAATEKASVVLPACGFAEKRGSMVNGKGRLQRLNRATRPPGNARDDWEILRDLLQAIGGGDSLHSIEDVFRRMSETVPQFAGLSLSKIGDLGVHVLEIEELPSTHPSDEEAIEQAIAVQAARRGVRHDLDHGQAHPSTSLNREVEPQVTPRS